MHRPRVASYKNNEALHKDGERGEGSFSIYLVIGIRIRDTALPHLFRDRTPRRGAANKHNEVVPLGDIFYPFGKIMGRPTRLPS